MANEHDCLEEWAIPTSFTVADGAGIEKGTLLKLSDPNTAAAQSAKEDIIAGVAAGEKIQSDGNTRLAVWRSGVFKATASGTISVGDALISAATANILETAGVNAEDIVGISRESCTDGQTFMYELKPMTMNLA